MSLSQKFNFGYSLCFFWMTAAPTCWACGPELASVSSPSEDFFSTGQISWYITWSLSTIALIPVRAVNLPETNIIRAIRIVELSMWITTTLMFCNALAACLTPASVFCAFCFNGRILWWCSTLAIIAFSWWAVSTTAVSNNNWESKSSKDQEFFGYA